MNRVIRYIGSAELDAYAGLIRDLRTDPVVLPLARYQRLNIAHKISSGFDHFMLCMDDIEASSV